jgi:transcriptional regulator with XRE-family HTH domain
MKSRAGDRFKSRSELGRRLRELRLKAGLTQQMLAVAMGSECQGNHTVVSRLENGRMENPGIGLVADYLRACRAGFKDILGVLDPYTSRPTVVEVQTLKALAKVREGLPPKVDKAVERYDRRIMRRAELKREPFPAPAERLRRARNFGLSQVWAGRVRREVVRIIETRHLGAGTLCEHYLQDYAARVWRILIRTRGKSEGKRPVLLEEAAGLFVVAGGPSAKDLQAIRESLLDYFRQLEVAGELDK